MQMDEIIRVAALKREILVMALLKGRGIRNRTCSFHLSLLGSRLKWMRKLRPVQDE